MKRLIASVGVALIAAGSTLALPQAHASSELVPNPSVEQLSRNGRRPAKWWKTHEGTSRAKFRVTQPGDDSETAADLVVTDYVDGNASWFFEPVEVEPGARYAYSDSYQSTATTTVTVDVETASGAHEFIALPSAPASDSSFQQYKAEFAVPADATAVTVRHALNSDGRLTTDTFSLQKVGDGGKTVTVPSTTKAPSVTSAPSVTEAPTTAPPATAAPTTAPPATAAPTTTAAPEPQAPSTVTGDFYVSPSGSDSNPGTAAAPFKTIQKAASVVSGGQTVVVRDGVYTDRSCGQSMVCVDRGGKFVAENRWGAKLDGRNQAANGFDVNSDNVRIEGFEIMNLANASGSTSAIELYDAGNGSQIIGNNIHNIGQICTTTTNGQVGIFVEVDNVTIERNYIHHIGRNAPGEGCSYASSYAGWEVHDHGIYLNGGGGTRRGATIRNNVFANVERGWSVQIYNGAVTGLDLSNNTFAYGNPNRDESMIVIYDMSLTSSSIRNNVFFDPDGGSPISTGGSLNLSGTTISNNITNGTAIADTNLNGATNNQTGTDPRLGTDLRPTTGSPAIDNGAALGTTSVAYNGTPRPQGNAWDIGAHEQ